MITNRSLTPLEIVRLAAKRAYENGLITDDEINKLCRYKMSPSKRRIALRLRHFFSGVSNGVSK